MKNISYIVLPPGHGKTYNHNSNRGIIDAGTLVPRGKTPELRILRRQAELTNSWNSYDSAWADMLETAAPDNCVLLLPSRRTAENRNWSYLCCLYLPAATWVENLAKREQSKEKVDKFLTKCMSLYTEATQYGKKCESNQEIEHYIKVCAVAFSLKCSSLFNKT